MSLISLAMILHAILNAMVFYRPTPPPHEWKGELALFPIIIGTFVLWCLAYYSAHT